MRPIRLTTYVAVVTLAISVSSVTGQNCILKVGAWEGYPETVTSDGGRLTMRKATVNGFSATATNEESRTTHKGVPLMGYLFFENIPEGGYQIMVRKAGFKTSIQPYHFACAQAEDGFAFIDVLMFRGNPKETVTNSKVVRLGRLTRLGSMDSDTGGYPPPPRPVPKTVSGGVLNGKALSLPKPFFPEEARAIGASGAVSVLVLIDEKGAIISVNAISGHPLLRPPAEAAAKSAIFAPVTLSGQPVKVSGVITYNFVP